jgi:glycosyltransferase involved in cell wall biosynthesis
MTRIVFVAQRIALPDDGPEHGSQVHVANSLAALREEFDVLPLLADDAQALAAAPALARALVPAHVRGLRRDLRLIRDDRNFASRAVALAREYRADVVYERSEYLSTTGLRLSRALGIPLVLEVNGVLSDDAQALYRSFAEPLGVRIERRKLLAADAVVVESPGMVEALPVRPRRVELVPNSVADDRVRAEPRTVRPDSAVVGWLGHLMPWHVSAIGFLIASAEAIARVEPRVRFDVIGGGPGMADLEARAPASFRFHGVATGDRLQQLLEAIDIAVVPDMPPHKLPVKVVEFAAAGLPIVAPSSPSFDAQLAPGVEYQPFDRLDPLSFQRALLDVLGDPAARARLGEAARQAAAERFTRSAASEKLASLVRSLV